MTELAAAPPRSCSQRSRRRLVTTIVLLPFAARAPGQVPFARQRERMLDVIDAMMRATGEQTGYRSVHVWTVRDGVPVRFAEYVDAPLTLPAAHAATS